MNRFLYVIVDQVANMFVGGVQTHPHDAPAIRMFGDVLSDPQGLGRHPLDYDLVCCGEITPGGQIVETSDRVVMKGSAFVAAQTPKEV